jgi:S1-C subfamily serine protease
MSNEFGFSASRLLGFSASRLLGFSLLLCVGLHAEEFTTLDGDHYTHATLKRVEPDGIVISYSDGVVKLKFKNLPKEVCDKYGYSPVQEALYLADRQANDAAAYQSALKEQGISTNAPAVTQSTAQSLSQASPTTTSTPLTSSSSSASITHSNGITSQSDTSVSWFQHMKKVIKDFIINLLHRLFPWAFPTPLVLPAPAPPQPSPSPLSDIAEYGSLSKFIVIISGDHGDGIEGRGSGFMVKYNNKIFLFTNIHVLDEDVNITCQTLSGRKLALGRLYLSNDYDLAAIELPEENDGLDLQANTDKSVSIGDEVVVLGNSNGEQVVTYLKGKISSIGPELIETDAKFVSGNSGSPIISKTSHKVLGIATFSVLRTANSFGSDSIFNNVERRFAYRLDNVPSWSQSTCANFFDESNYLKRINARTYDLWDAAHGFFHDIKNWHDFVIQQNSFDDTVYKSVTNYQKELSFLDDRSSSQDFKYARERFLHSLENGCRSDMIPPFKLSAWHQKQFSLYQDIRTLLQKYFSSLIENTNSRSTF